MLRGALCGGLLLAVACAPRPATAPELRLPLARFGPDRIAVPYSGPYAAEKRALVERINRDRAAAGVAPVAADSRAELAGDLFCWDAALSGSFGHYDLLGRPPYLRFALAGGVDYHGENAGAYSAGSGRTGHSVLELLLLGHDAMMAEVPPDDGHRRTVLDPLFTHLGIGVAMVGGEFRMTEEFSRIAFEWIELPGRPLPAHSTARFAGRPLPGWEVGLVEVRHEPPPQPLTLRELRSQGSYRYPRVVQTLRPAGEGPELAREARVELEASRVLRLTVRLDAGPGHYYVLCYVRPAGNRRAILHPATSALVVAE